jgi:hypothetical protein
MTKDQAEVAESTILWRSTLVFVAGRDGRQHTLVTVWRGQTSGKSGEAPGVQGVGRAPEKRQPDRGCAGGSEECPVVEM